MLFRTHYGVMLLLFIILQVVFQVVWRSIEPCKLYTKPHGLKFFLKHDFCLILFLFTRPFKKAAVGECVLKLLSKESGIEVAPFDMHKGIHECSNCHCCNREVKINSSFVVLRP